MPPTWTEQEKYTWIHQHHPRYGNRNHGQSAYPIVLDMGVKSLLDVGCGNGHFVEWAKTQGIRAVGVDIGSDYGTRADACNLPFPNLFFELITAFDLLEHLQEDDLDIALREFRRVSSRWLFSIGYGRSRIRGPDTWLQLHPIAKKEEWWIDKLSKYGQVSKIGETHTKKGRSFLIVR